MSEGERSYQPGISDRSIGTEREKQKTVSRGGRWRRALVAAPVVAVLSLAGCGSNSVSNAEAIGNKDAQPTLGQMAETGGSSTELIISLQNNLAERVINAYQNSPELVRDKTDQGFSVVINSAPENGEQTRYGYEYTGIKGANGKFDIKDTKNVNLFIMNYQQGYPESENLLYSLRSNVQKGTITITYGFSGTSVILQEGAQKDKPITDTVNQAENLITNGFNKKYIPQINVPPSLMVQG